MTSEDLYAIILNRGITPRIGDGGSLVLDAGEQKGPLSGLSRILMNAVKHHETALKRLVAAQWMPPTNQDRSQRSGAAPAAAETAAVGRVFDQDAEKLVRDLYAFDYGIRWDREQSRFRITPATIVPRFAQWWNRAKPMWDRIVAHLADPLAPGSVVIELRHSQAGQVHQWRQDHPVYSNRKTKSDDVNGEAKKEKAVLIDRGYLHTYVTQEAWNKHMDGCVHPFEGEPGIQYNQWRWVGEPGGYWRALWGRYVESRGGLATWVPWGFRENSR